MSKKILNYYMLDRQYNHIIYMVRARDKHYTIWKYLTTIFMDRNGKKLISIVDTEKIIRKLCKKYG
jgi:hypothetical protein